MENSSRPVVVKRMPEKMNVKEAHNFLQEIQPFLNSDRPQLVFDMSQVRQLDAAGVDMLLHCMRQAVKHDGDLKLAALSPHAAVILELTRAGRLFEIYDTCTSAAKSFSCFLPNAIKHLYPHPAHAAGSPILADVFAGKTEQEGAGRVA